jgi:hypothetical protein
MSTNKESTLKQFMTNEQRKKLGEWPTTHRNCIDLFGVARPGKTKRDRHNKGDF